MTSRQRSLRVLTLSRQGNEYRAVVARSNDAMWVFGGRDPHRLNYVQSVWLWPDSFTSPEPSSEEVAQAVATYGKQRASD
jgi:hypothetical protein